MAHEVALAMIKNGISASFAIWDAWQYADEMQAEHEKRMAAEAQKCDDEVAKIISDWQPDWSQAPKGANWWAVDGDGFTAYWFVNEPSQGSIEWTTEGCDCYFNNAPNFNYQGDWRESLRKRP